MKIVGIEVRRQSAIVSAFVAVVVLACAIAIYRLPSADRTVPNITSILQLGLVAVGLISLLLLAEQNRQISCGNAEQSKQTASWNKCLSYHNFFGDLITMQMSQALRGTTDACGFTSAMQNVEPMSANSVEDVVRDDAHSRVCSSYLDDFEEFCAAVHAGVVDKEYAYTLEATRVIRAWIVYEPYITKRRSSVRYSRCYIELQRLAATWIKRREEEEAKKNASEGVKPRV
jgi:hypothetical protein